MRRARGVTDPFVGAVLLSAAMAVVGTVVLVAAWQGVASSVDIAEQVAYVVSGGFGGLALIGFAAGMLVIEERRWAEAQRRARFERVLAAADELLRAAAARERRR